MERAMSDEMLSNPVDLATELTIASLSN